MCGRYSLSRVGEELWEQFSLESAPADVAPRYTIAPTQPVLALVDRRPRNAIWLRWGLIPPWAKNPNVGVRMINARVETASQKPAFRQAYKERLTLILADGFFEWKEVGSVHPSRRTKRKQPMWFQPIHVSFLY